MCPAHRLEPVSGPITVAKPSGDRCRRRAACRPRIAPHSPGGGTLFARWRAQTRPPRPATLRAVGLGGRFWEGQRLAGEGAEAGEQVQSLVSVEHPVDHGVAAVGLGFDAVAAFAVGQFSQFGQ